MDATGELAPTGFVGRIAPGVRVYATPLMITTAGGGTEDRAIIFRPSDHFLFTSPVRFPANWQTSATTGQIQFVSVQYAATLQGRYAGGVALIGGNSGNVSTGMQGPAGY
jgi:hypothetical protein